MKNNYRIIVHTKKAGEKKREHVVDCGMHTTVENIHEWMNALSESYGPTTKIQIAKIIDPVQVSNEIPVGITVDPLDVKVDTFHPRQGSGFGVQIKTAVKVTHIPTGLSATSETGRSAHQNRTLATGKLKKLLQNHYAGETQ